MKANDIIWAYLRIWCVVTVLSMGICWIVNVDFVRFVEILLGITGLLGFYCACSCFFHVQWNQDEIIKEQTENSQTESQQTKPKKRKMKTPVVKENSGSNN